MWVIFKKEIRSFLGSFIGYIVMAVFLIISGLFLWLIKDNSILELGIGSLQVMFNIAPYLLIFLVSAITMRSLSEERRLGTIETLTTKPISDSAIILGKFFCRRNINYHCIITHRYLRLHHQNLAGRRPNPGYRGLDWFLFRLVAIGRLLCRYWVVFKFLNR